MAQSKASKGGQLSSRHKSDKPLQRSSPEPAAYRAGRDLLPTTQQAGESSAQPSGSKSAIVVAPISRQVETSPDQTRRKPEAHTSALGYTLLVLMLYKELPYESDY